MWNAYLLGFATLRGPSKEFQGEVAALIQCPQLEESSVTMPETVNTHPASSPGEDAVEIPVSPPLSPMTPGPVVAEDCETKQSFRESGEGASQTSSTPPTSAGDRSPVVRITQNSATLPSTNVVVCRAIDAGTELAQPAVGDTKSCEVLPADSDELRTPTTLSNSRELPVTPTAFLPITVNTAEGTRPTMTPLTLGCVAAGVVRGRKPSDSTCYSSFKESPDTSLDVSPDDQRLEPPPRPGSAPPGSSPGVSRPTLRRIQSEIYGESMVNVFFLMLSSSRH